MTEGFWKWVASIASRELNKREIKQRVAGLCNRLDIMSGEIAAGFDSHAMNLRTQVAEEISDQFASAGPLIVQRVNQTLDPKLNDVTVVLKDIIEERTKKGFTLNASLLGRILGNQAVQASKSEKRQNYIMEAFNELARQSALHDQSNTDRNLTLINMLRLMDDKMNNKLDQLQGMQIKFFENLTLQIRMATSKGKERYSPAPKLEWLMDNLDHMMELCDALRLAKSNDAPRSTMTMRAISAIRSMELFSVSNIRREIERWLNSQDNDQQLCAA